MATTFESTAPIGRNATQIAAEGLSHLHPFRFTGTAATYFGIWIVNMALTMLTLGIYSAWAKVRTKRYFHGHTVLEGSAFGYHALPVQILKGRLIVLAAFVAYMVIVSYLPWFDFVLYLVILPLVVPWIVVRALRFNRRITSYRHIRFDFDGDKWEAFVVYLMLWFGSVLTLGLLYPYAAWRLRRFVVDNSLFGTSRFHFDGRPGAFYRPYGLVALFGLMLGPLALAVLYQIVYQMDPSLPGRLLTYPPELVVLALLIAMTPAFLVAAAYLHVQIENYSWDATRLRSDRFQLDLAFGPLLWIYLTNLLAIIASFGLLLPWARVRLARYKLSRLCMLSRAGLEGHLADQRAAAAATGEELGDALGLDLGL